MSRLAPNLLRTAARRTLAALALAAAPAAAARAQLAANVVYRGSQTSAVAFGYHVGPVTEQLTLTTPGLVGQAYTVTAFCVDFANEIRAGAAYTANVTSLAAVLGGHATLATTRQGAAGLDGYKKAAYLIDQFQSAGVASLTGDLRDRTWGALQGALWALFSPTQALALDASTSTTDKTVVEYWHAQANAFAGNAAAFNGYDYGRFHIITDVAAAGTVSGAGVQEFMTTSTVTPEPGTVLLLGGGLVAVAAAARRRPAAARAVEA